MSNLLVLGHVRAFNDGPIRFILDVPRCHIDIQMPDTFGCFPEEDAKMIVPISQTVLIPWYIDIPERLVLYRPFTNAAAPAQWDDSVIAYCDDKGFCSAHILLVICEFREDA